MKIHQIFIKENLHMLFLTHFLVPRQFMLVLKPALQYCEPSYQATTNFVKLSINSELNKTNLVQWCTRVVGMALNQLVFNGAFSITVHANEVIPHLAGMYSLSSWQWMPVCGVG